MESADRGLGRREILKLTAFAGATVAGAALVGARLSLASGELSLKGKRIGVSTVGTDHHADLQAYNAQIEEVKRLGGVPIGVDAGRNDGKLISQLQTLIAQKPDAIVQQLGTLTVIDPWLKKAPDAGIPVLALDVGSTNSPNNAASDNWVIGKNLALQLVSDIGGEGKIVVFNGFYGVTPCAIRYDQLVNVIKYFPEGGDHQAGATRRYPQYCSRCLYPGHRNREPLPGKRLDQGDLVGLGYPSSGSHTWPSWQPAAWISKRTASTAAPKPCNCSPIQTPLLWPMWSSSRPNLGVPRSAMLPVSWLARPCRGKPMLRPCLRPRATSKRSSRNSGCIESGLRRYSSASAICRLVS
ncbi:ABC transporter substrate binding protein (ribose) (plasmid) [Rhizobium grahamii CCGE 502]|uniref:ABC transporter substrate binding protein (Ribose) n=1 Tax=Rhizobium grahamii CCGE 502 TaxID=990285 RepID=S3H3L8_9HYPH|nr:ABC transporter substrate binding protein (ribose) [Rhizobium grahamii CCGE 502]